MSNSRKIEVRLPAGCADAQKNIASIFKGIHEKNAKDNTRHAYYGELKDNVLEVTLTGEWSPEQIAQLETMIATSLLALAAIQ